MEVDVVAEDEGQEEEGQRNRPERDPLSEEIVMQLEKGLQRWSGFGEEGWMGDVTTVSWYFLSKCVAKFVFSGTNH
jgi:chromatin structure-remodeling complex subunit RSC1/2